jgi:seryl-tRNA synthetase
MTRKFSSRGNSNELSLDSNLASSNPELLIQHLQSRKADSSMIERVLAIKELRHERVKLIKAGDTAKNVRKNLSKDIGMLMRQQKLDEVAVLKAQVEAATSESHAADEQLVKIDKQMHDILAGMPNLLDDRYSIMQIVGC